MGTAPPVGACKLTPDPVDPTLFRAIPGPVTLELVSKVGNVTFLMKNTDVLDANGKSVNPTKTPTTLSFSVTAGGTFIVEAEYFIFPTHSSGSLRERCPGGTVLSDITAVNNPQQFTIQG